MEYEVLTDTLCQGWINCWTTTEPDGTEHPTTFPTEEEAEAEIQELLETCNGDGRDPDEYYDRDEFMIVPVGKEGPRVAKEI